MGETVKSQCYKWKRFWCRREENFYLSDGGFLSDPDAGVLYSPNSNAHSFDDISSWPCLVLLGEPGIGKSRALESAYEGAKDAIDEAGDVADVPALPGCRMQGTTFEEAIANIREVIVMCVQEMREDGIEIDTHYPEVIGIKTLEIAV